MTFVILVSNVVYAIALLIPLLILYDRPQPERSNSARGVRFSPRLPVQNQPASPSGRIGFAGKRQVQTPPILPADQGRENLREPGAISPPDLRDGSQRRLSGNGRMICKAVSRQRLDQIRRMERGLCVRCNEPRITKTHCQMHREEFNDLARCRSRRIAGIPPDAPLHSRSANYRNPTPPVDQSLDKHLSRIFSIEPEKKKAGKRYQRSTGTTKTHQPAKKMHLV